MTLDGQRRIDELFLAVVDLPADEQGPFLDTACGGDAATRAEIESLIASERKGAAGITSAIEREAMALLGEQTLVGTRLGAYRVLREIGRGGMGSVYLATRDDDEFHKEVAVKVVKRGMDTDEVLGRFRRERQILANLEHSCIARLIDGGSTRDGRPFLVMEFVGGEPIDRYCAGRNLSVADRCRLFVKVCDAVSHAHHNLIVHCDLKPSNILITGDGTPKLLDFGVARILDPAAEGDVTTSRTSRPLTPDYASPEQVRGTATSTATDIYSLGVILHELLTGRKALRITSLDPIELEKVICETDLPAPSAAVAGLPGGQRLRRQLAGDLDNIVMQATQKTPARRYASVDHLAEDVRCHLESRPVSARKDSRSYRALTFVRRHRVPVFAAASAAASLIVGMAMALAQAGQARIAERSAEGRLAQIVTLSDRSLSNVYGRLERLPGAVPARKELVSSTVDLLQNVAKEAGSDPRVRIALAKAYLKLGALQGDPDAPNAGDVAGGLQSSRAGAALLEPIRLDDADRLLLWADLQNQIGKLLGELHDPNGARAVLRRAIVTIEPLGPRADRGLATLYLSASRSAISLDLSQSLEWANKSLEIAKAGAERAPEDTDLLLVLSTAYTQVGYLSVLRGNPEGAEAPMAESIRIRERLANAHPTDLLLRRYVRLAYEHYAALQASPLQPNLSHPDIARTFYKKAKPLEEADRNDPDNHSQRFDYANFVMEMAIIDVPPDGLAESLQALRQAAATFESLAAEEPGVQRHDRGRVAAYTFIGHRLLAMGKYREAAAEYQRALVLVRKVLDQSPGDPQQRRLASLATSGLARARALGHLAH